MELGKQTEMKTEPVNQIQWRRSGQTKNHRNKKKKLANFVDRTNGRPALIARQKKDYAEPVEWKDPFKGCVNQSHDSL